MIVSKPYLPGELLSISLPDVMGFAPVIVTFTRSVGAVPKFGAAASDPPERVMVLPLAIVSVVPVNDKVPEARLSKVFTVNDGAAPVRVTEVTVPCKLRWSTVMAEPEIST